MIIFVTTYIGSLWMTLALLFMLANPNSWDSQVIGVVHLLVGMGIIIIGAIKKRGC